MKQITDPETYKALISGFKKGQFLSNCFFLTDNACTLISQNCLFYDLENGNLFLYEKKDCFYRFYYWILCGERLSPPWLDMPLVAELVYQDSMTEGQRTSVGLLEKLGFTLGRNSARMTLREAGIKLPSGTADPSVSIVRGDSRFGGAALALLRNTFNPLYAYLPDEAELSRLLASGDLYLAVREGETVGVLNMGKEKNQAWIRHLAVKENARGAGIATGLLKAGMRDNADAKVVMCWVDASNSAAIALYQKFGLQMDGRKADEYVLLNTPLAGR